MMTLLKDLGTRNGIRYGIYRCHCGRETEKRVGNVKSGYTKSCGCLPKSKKGTTRNNANSKNQTQSFTPTDSGIFVPPLPVPSLDQVTKTNFRKVAAFPMWEIKIGDKTIDRQPMSLAERKLYKG